MCGSSGFRPSPLCVTFKSAIMNYGQAETLIIIVSIRIHPESRLWLRDLAERL